MNIVFAAAFDLQSFFQEKQWQFCFIGGVTLQRWGMPRQTLDVDVTLLTGLGNEEAYVDPLLAHFRARRTDAREFALRQRVLLLESAAGVGLDIALGGLPFEIGTVNRASDFQIGPEKFLRTCSAEDLIVHKSFANRGQDWVDVENVLLKQQGKLNLPLVFSELKPLVDLKEEPEILERLHRTMERVYNLK